MYTLHQSKNYDWDIFQCFCHDGGAFDVHTPGFTIFPITHPGYSVCIGALPILNSMYIYDLTKIWDFLSKNEGASLIFVIAFLGLPCISVNLSFCI